MLNNHHDPSNLMERLFFDTGFSIEEFRRSLQEVDNQYSVKDPRHKSIIFLMIQTLVIEERFYDQFCLSYYNTASVNSQHSCKNQTQILSFGFKILEQIFSRPQLVQNDNFIMSPVLKKCKLDVFMLIAICKGYLKNASVKKDKVKSFFIQNFKKNNYQFVGIDRFCQFHQCLVEKSSGASLFTYEIARKQRQYLKLEYFLDFFVSFKDFFPLTLQIDNTFFRMMVSIKLDTQADLQLYDRFQKQYIRQNSYHLTTTCKNIRFLIQFFRNPFNQKTSQFYPQKSFVKLLGKYSKSQIDKIVSFSEVGLTWSQEEISSTVGNIYKLGLTNVTLNLFRALLAIWLKNGFVDLVMKVAETYVPKTFIFMKHEKLFDNSLAFVQEFVLGPRNPTSSIMNRLLEKMLVFVQKQCPSNKKREMNEFMCLVEAKYEKVATLEDKLYIQLKNYIKNLKQVHHQELSKDEVIQQKLNQYQWQQIKVPLFGSTSTSNQAPNIPGKQASEYKGLYNIGNSCYMNSFLQCLFMNIEFRRKILEVSTLGLEKSVLQKMREVEEGKMEIKMEVENGGKNNENNEANKNALLMARQCIRPTAQLQRLFAQLTKSKRTAISPLAIKNVSSPQFRNTFQQDTIEFGRSFIDIISKSSFQNLFEGEQTNQIVCPQCSKSRFKKESFIDLMLTEVEDEEEKGDERASTSTKESGNGRIVIERMLKKFFQPEEMENLECDYCQSKSQKSTKKHYISKHPNYLILTMKRFHYDVKEGKNVKKHYNVDLKEGFMSLEGELYQIYGLIVHRVIFLQLKGQSANSGHYFAFCREWRFDQGNNKQDEEKIVKVAQVEHEKRMIDEFEESLSSRPQKMQIEQDKLNPTAQNEPQSNLITSNKSFIPNKDRRWLCLNDSIVSVFESFQNVKQFLDLNQEDTPYILFYQKVSHVSSPDCQYLKDPINLRQPLEKFLEKDNIEYAKLMENKKRGNTNSQKVDWKNFGKVKGFTAYDYFKFARQDEDENGGGNGFGGGFGNNPIL